ncbi:MAG: hypothetical protein K0R65_2220 [Crocinitomicaceae bacterium]|jgi:glycosyltransferase involved in cell wall biosynthesis|nr:hypothetical protein [Crocinitomicaceae bacterium]
MNRIKLVILYQVIFSYRLPIYNRISNIPGIDFELWHCPDMPGTKKMNAKGAKNFKTRVLRTVFKKFQTNNSDNVMPVSFFLFTKLVFKNPQIVLSEGTSSIYNSSIAFLYCKIFRKKFIWWSLGELKNREYQGLRKKLNSWVQYIEKNADAIFTYSSQGEQYFLRQGIKPEKIFKAVNVIDTDIRLEQISKLDASQLKRDDKFNLVFVGSIIQEKNLKLVFQVLSKLHAKHPDAFRFHIIGDGNYLPTLKEEFLEFPDIRDIVTFHGRVEDKLSELLVGCDLLVLPGLGGLSISEGMVHGLPVICGVADGSENDLIDDRNGFVLEDMSEENLQEKIELLYNDRALLQQMKTNALEKIKHEYSIGNYMNVLQNCIESVKKK